MVKIPLLPLVAVLYTLNYLNLATDGVIIGSTRNSLILLNKHKDGDFVYAQIACQGDLSFAKYTQESLYQIRAEFTGEIPAEASIMPGALFIEDKVIPLEGVSHEPIGAPHVTPPLPGALSISISGRMLITASHICQTFQVEQARFVTPTFFTIRGAAFSLAVNGEKIG